MKRTEEKRDHAGRLNMRKIDEGVLNCIIVVNILGNMIEEFCDTVSQSNHLKKGSYSRQLCLC